VHRIYKSRDGVEADFIPLSLFGHQAENFSKMVQKGQMLGIDGQIKTSTYADPSTGEKKYGWSVAVDHFYLLNSGSHDGGQRPQEKLSQAVISNGMHKSSAHNPQQDLYNQYHQQTAPTPQPVINKQLANLDSQLEKAGIPFD
jgi:single-strand DNA-binding protein